jgi:polyhydroxybutyrate depolymerase
MDAMSCRRPCGFAAAVAALGLLAGAGTASAQPGQTVRRNLEVGGTKRSYLLHVPAGIQRGKPAPLVFSFHGRGGQGAGQERFIHFDAVADREGFLVAYPDGLDRRWDDGRHAEASSPRDVEFVKAMLAEIGGLYTLDHGRIFAMGMSNGGFMSLRLACELNSEFSAIAVVAAALTEGLTAHCAPSKPVSVVLINGTADPLVPYQGGELGGSEFFGRGGRVLSTAATIAKWVDWDGCSATAPTERLPQLDTADGTAIERVRHSPCRNGSEVTLYTVAGGGHAWPGATQYLPVSMVGRASHNLDASTVIGEFFRLHARPPARLEPPPSVRKPTR